MGYLTTLTIRNDCLDTIEKNPEEFTKKVVAMAINSYDIDNRSISVGNCGNPVEVQLPRHADDHTCYVHMGNCLVEMNAYSRMTADVANRCPEFFDRMVAFMESEVKELKKLKKRLHGGKLDAAKEAADKEAAKND